jgi:hypothetical protein
LKIVGWQKNWRYSKEGLLLSSHQYFLVVKDDRLALLTPFHNNLLFIILLFVKIKITAHKAIIKRIFVGETSLKKEILNKIFKTESKILLGILNQGKVSSC